MKAEFKVKRQILLDLNEQEEYGLDLEDLLTEEDITEMWNDCSPDLGLWFEVDFGEYYDEEIPYSLNVEEYHCSTSFVRELPGFWIRFDNIRAIGLIDQSDLDLKFDEYNVVEVEPTNEPIQIMTFKVKK